MFHQADGFSGHPSSKEQLDSQCLSNSSSRNSLVQGQMINSSIMGTATTVVSIIGVPHTLLEIALNSRNLFWARTPTRTLTRTIKARVRSKLCKSGKGRLTLPPLLNFRRTHQLWRVPFLPIILFDSGITHSFIGTKCGAILGLDLNHIKAPDTITTPSSKIASQPFFLIWKLGTRFF